MTEKKDRNEYFRAYRAANREHLNEYHRNYNNRNKIKNYRRLASYYKRKAEEMEKQEVNKDAENIDIEYDT